LRIQSELSFDRDRVHARVGCPVILGVYGSTLSDNRSDRRRWAQRLPLSPPTSDIQLEGWRMVGNERSPPHMCGVRLDDATPASRGTPGMLYLQE
jgi:hypothetical protein